MLTKDEFAAAAAVSPAAMARLEAMDAVFLDSASRHNLVARSTIPERWSRHYLDSAQLAALLPAGISTIVDLGSGAGFPALVLAAMLAEKDVHVTMIESTGKKAAFLSAAADAMGVAVTVIQDRIESTKLKFPPDIITARALARLDKLLDYGAGIQGQNTKYFFLKGQDVEDELTEAAKCWHMDVKRHTSQTNPQATILEIENLSRGKKSKERTKRG
ncbi:MAG: 16S rRNA (guanine(527)-N(7))-methyltransferase RsmG [Marinicaulis sp.]|nr:16S rRNA (guanine(527)-N(7))-methyltransferase RsmG [Marinicaulis sp.]